jgi:endonuclease/exonuclease/phosphatase family metal-dependent hydrolase
MSWRNRLALGSVCGVLAGTAWTGVAAGLGSESAPAVPVLADYQIGTFNMAGGNADHGWKGNEAPDALVRSIQDRRPAFVTLQEACADWTERLDSQLADYAAVFDPVRTGGGAVARCEHPSDFGNALVYRNDLGVSGAAVGHALGSPAGREQREMLCVRSEARRIVVCSAHLTHNSEPARLTEARNARAILASAYAGYTTFLGGDLNDQPLTDTPGTFYHSGYGFGASGALKEVDSPCGNEIKERQNFFTPCRSGEGTHGGGPLRRKIDYLFVSPSVHVSWGDATSALHSDHVPLWAGVRF